MTTTAFTVAFRRERAAWREMARLIDLLDAAKQRQQQAEDELRQTAIPDEPPNIMLPVIEDLLDRLSESDFERPAARSVGDDGGQSDPRHRGRIHPAPAPRAF
jgi:hypothetical protein